MGIAQSRITAQGQVTIPVSVMRQFGLAPGELISWDSIDGHLTVAKAGQYSIEDVRTALNLPKALHKTDADIREGLKAMAKAKYAGR